MKKVLITAVILGLGGGAYAAGNALDGLKAAAPAAALEDVTAFIPAVTAKTAESAETKAPEQNNGYMFMWQWFPADHSAEAIMAECYLNMKAGAESADYEKVDNGYLITSKWKRLSGDPKVVSTLEIYPKSMYTYEDIAAQAHLKTLAGAKQVNIVQSDTHFSLSCEWDVLS